MKYKKNRVTENQGVLYVQGQVNEQGSIFRVIHQESDVGLDGIIEFVLNEEVTGVLIGVQIKSGDSYLNKRKDGFKLSVSQEHIDYWLGHHLPVYFIFYSPTLKKGAYTSIRNYVDREKYHDRLPVKKIEVSLDKEFDSETISEHFPILVDTYQDEQILLNCVENCLSGTSQEKEDAFQILAYHPFSRDRKLTIFIASKLIFHENIEIAKRAVLLLAYGVGRQRWSWNPNNKDEKGLIAYAVELVCNFNKSEIEKIISLTDNEDFHGPEALGERVFDIVCCIGELAMNLLEEIMQDPTQEMIRRGNCMYLFYGCDGDLIIEHKEHLLENIYTRKVYKHLIKDDDEPEMDLNDNLTLFD